MSEVLWSVRARGGVCTAADLLEAGLSRRSIANAVERGTVERLRRGVFADPAIPQAAKRAVRVGGRLACVSAARLHGLRMLHDPDALHVSVDPRATRLRHPDDATRRLRPREDASAVRLHWTASAGGGPIESLEECLLHMLGCRPELDALCALDSAREHVDWIPGRPQLLDDAAFARMLERASPSVRRIAARSVTGSQAVGETVARERLRAARIPVRPQVRLPGGFRADLLIGERLVFEVDGEGPHTAPGAFDRDRARIGWLRAIGYSYLSYSHSQVLDDWASIETVIRLLLRHGEHRWGGQVAAAAA